MLAIGRAGALKLLQQVGEGLLIDNGKKHFADDPIGVSECRFGQPTQQGVLTGHPFQSANSSRSTRRSALAPMRWMIWINNSIKSSVISCARSQQ